MNFKVLSLAVSAFLVSCAGSQQSTEMASPPPDTAIPAAGTIDAPRRLEVPIMARSDSHLSGKAIFEEVSGGVKVTIEVNGAPPGLIATHIHENGDCSAPDAKSAGEHYNPQTEAHGLPDQEHHHMGDLGNIDVKADGSGSTERTIKGASLQAGAPGSILGRAIIVHEKQDDGGQPSGNAGSRIGCGVITSQIRSLQ